MKTLMPLSAPVTVESAAARLTLSTRSGRRDLPRAASWAVAAQVTAADALPFFV